MRPSSWISWTSTSWPLIARLGILLQAFARVEDTGLLVGVLQHGLAGGGNLPRRQATVLVVGDHHLAQEARVAAVEAHAVLFDGHALLLLLGGLVRMDAKQATDERLVGLLQHLTDVLAVPL